MRDLSSPAPFLEPDGADLHELVQNRVSRRIAEVLLEHPDGLDIHELRARVPEYASQMHFDRRLRDLDKPFVLTRERSGGTLRYRLTGRRPIAPHPDRISKTLRAEILFRDGSRCQMCGASPQRDDTVQLEIDHKIPINWDGSNEEDNLWALCKTCSEGKHAFFASADEHAGQMRSAINSSEVHRRLGGLLRAFGVGMPVPAYMLAIVASAGQFQEDWQRRLRELRDLGWDYEVTKRKENGRIVASYTLTKDGGWPPAGVTIREALRRR
jgi:5-methylcytosine-specific restriction endonuclease McrA